MPQAHEHGTVIDHPRPPLMSGHGVTVSGPRQGPVLARHLVSPLEVGMCYLRTRRYGTAPQ